MPLEDSERPFRPKETLHIPTPVIGAVVALVVVLLLTYKGFSDSLIWLGVMVAIPAGIFFLSRPAILMAFVLVVSSAKMWLPFLPLDLPVDILMRFALVVAVVAGAIIRKDVQRTAEPYRLAAYVFICLIGLTMVRRGAGFYQLGGNLWGGKVYLILLVNLFFLLLIPGTIRMGRKMWTLTLALTLLAPVMVVLADAAYVYSGGRFYHLYYVFRPASSVGSTAFELTQQDAGLWRLQSFSQLKLAWLAMLFFPWLRRTPLGWMGVIFLVFMHFVLTALSGFRAALAITPVYLAVYLFLAYPQQRRRLVVLGCSSGVFLLLLLYALGPRLPSPAQRAISWLPGIQLDARVMLDADHSSNWRLNLWQIVWDREVPKFWLTGKGLAFHPGKLVDQSEVQVDPWIELNNYIVTNDYHNGPLVLLVVFGIQGLIVVILLFFFGFRRGLRFLRMEWGDPCLRNYFLVYFTLYSVGVLGFIFIYGDLQGSLQGLLTNLVVMELLVASDPRLSLTPSAPEVRRLVHRPAARTVPRVAIPPLSAR
jgi:O-Antigen ligase